MIHEKDRCLLIGGGQCADIYSKNKSRGGVSRPCGGTICFSDTLRFNPNNAHINSARGNYFGPVLVTDYIGLARAKARKAKLANDQCGRPNSVARAPRRTPKTMRSRRDVLSISIAIIGEGKRQKIERARRSN